MADNSGKSSERVAAGLKGTLHNPNVGGEAKERAIQRLNDMGVSTEGSEPIKAVSTGKVSGIVDEIPKDEAEFKAPDVLGIDPEDDEYEFKPITAEERDEDLQMQNDTEQPSLKRRRVDSGSVLGPDGFAISKLSSKPGRATIPLFDSAFEATKKPRKQDVIRTNNPLDPSLLKPKSSTAIPHKPVQRPAFVLDSQLSSSKDTDNFRRTPAKSTIKAALVTSASGNKSMTKPPASTLSEAQGQSLLHETQAISENSSPTKPISKSRNPILLPKPDRTPAKTLLKPLVPPRLPTHKPVVGQKALPLPPPIHLPSFTTPSKPLRTIATTRVARATDLSTENGAAELASIVLQNPAVLETADTPEIKSGLDLSPQKSNPFGRAPKFVRNGLAAHAASLLSHANTSLALWAKEYSTLTRFPKPDLRLRVIRVFHRPSQQTHAKSNVGLALCRLLHNQSLLTRNERLSAVTEFPVLDVDEDNPSSSMSLVLFSFPSHPSSSSTPIRNPATFEEDVEFWIWKPWRTLTLNSSQLHSLSASNSGSAQDDGSGAVESIALFSDRFVCYRARTDVD
ncbi:hypothetical protein GGU10DRAFT_379286 [Lentinula aff. detonsa]|uniref:Uncharacterized protein n=1 Tax=Lentinula aff. detonsa TaxID=2804958 RepID=A0AA38L2A6_9AGAR|nr:hypothetical protein GGU10DRAFT_379286 [Lentinula aff. detonsa]